jgi:hypothetical protein
MGDLTDDDRTRLFRSARRRVWAYICENPGCTDCEVRDALGLNHNTARPRRIELEQAGLVRMVLPMRPVADGNYAERWESTGRAYPDVWTKPRVDTGNGDAVALRSVRRLAQWAAFCGDAELVELAGRMEAAVAERVAREAVAA